MSESPGDQPRRRQTNDPAFWQDLHDTFETALELLQQMAEAQGIAFETPSDADVEEQERMVDEQAHDHPLALSAAEYAGRVNRWFRRAKAMIHEWGREAALAAGLDAVTPELEQEVAALQEAVQEIADHRYRIHVKVLRAVRDRMRAGSPVLSPLRDSGGASAAEARDGIDRSIAMWMRLREFFPEEEDAILNLLVHLQNLRGALGREFPDLPAAPGAE